MFFKRKNRIEPTLEVPPPVTKYSPTQPVTAEIMGKRAEQASSTLFSNLGVYDRINAAINNYDSEVQLNDVQDYDYVTLMRIKNAAERLGFSTEMRTVTTIQPATRTLIISW